MKKISLFIAAAVAMVMASCNQKPTATLKTDIDSLSYAIGMSNGMEWSSLSQRMGLDSTTMEAFLKGFYEGTQMSNDPKKQAYVAGLQMGRQWGDKDRGISTYFSREIFGEDSTKTVNESNIYAGFMAAVAGVNDVMTLDSAQAFMQNRMDAIRESARAQAYAENKQKNEEYMAEMAKKEGIQELGNGVLYEVLTEGTGEVAADTSRVKVHYEGKLIDGTIFDSNLEGEPTTFRANQVIPGFKAALTTMPVGSKWVVYIPQDQAYGAQDMGNIKPFSALTFTITLEGIEK